ncbi:MAG TPA: hypothetical protein VHE08_05740 [Solirubrobacterales bacterium]|nr:hypothetical protein [Solirubrobacterales bacterium]
MGTPEKRRLRGSEPRGLRPDWRPLLDFAPDEIPEFMWMYRVELEDGTAIEAYKHSWTRRYLHLDSQGRAYLFLGHGRWEEVDPGSLLEDALAGCESRASIVRRNDWANGERIGWARSATRHRVSRKQTLWVIEHAGICFERGIGSDGDPLLWFYGDDESERPLEVMAAGVLASKLTVIHSMDLRDRFEDDYMEAYRWRRK